MAIIKKREDNDPKVTMIRNEMGDYVEQITTSENWVIYDKKPYKKEETFWVYGFHPLVQRKTFLFVSWFSNASKRNSTLSNSV